MAQASLRHLERLRRQDGWVTRSMHISTKDVMERPCVQPLDESITRNGDVNMDEACLHSWTRLAKILSMLKISLRGHKSPWLADDGNLMVMNGHQAGLKSP